MELAHTADAVPSLTVSCECLIPEEVNDLQEFLASSDPGLKITRNFRVRTYDSAEHHALLTGYHDLYILFTGLGIGTAVGTIAKEVIVARINDWFEKRDKAEEFELKTIYNSLGEPESTVKIFKKKPKS
jgi:hypothetical protein